MQQRIKKYKLKAKYTKEKSFQATSEDRVAKYCREKLFKSSVLVYESMYILLLDNSLLVQGTFKVSQGTTTGTVVDLLLIGNAICNSLAKNIIVVHNHPSGKLLFSKEDIKMHTKIKNAAKTLDCNVTDFIVVTKESHISLRKERFDLF